VKPIASGMRERIELRLRQVVGLSERDARRVADEVLDLFEASIDEFVARRHAELQREGYQTDGIYRQIQADLEEWRFAAPPMSLRQIRRRIYG
jgi:hypothetical protein